MGKDKIELPAVKKVVYFTSGDVTAIDIDKLRESPSNPRKHFDMKSLAQTGLSIKEKGIIEPLLVRVLWDNGAKFFEIVVGARRYRSAKMTGLEILKNFPDALIIHPDIKEYQGQKQIPCIIREYTDNEVLEIQVIENNQREDIHPLEEGEGFAALLKVEGYTVEMIGSKIGKSDKYVRERLQLAKLSPKAKEFYEANKIYYTHARILSRLTHEQQDESLKTIVQNDHLTSATHPLNVKSLEYWVESNVERKLSSASFPLDDKTLNKEMGACIGCIKNTASDGQLFPEYAEKGSKGTCLKPECFNIKVRAYAERLVKEKANDEKLKDVLMVSETSWKNNVKKVGKNERLVIGYKNWERVGKDEKGAQKAIIVGTREIKEKGKTIYVKLRNKKDAIPSKTEKRNNSYASEPELTPEQKAEMERKGKHKRTAGYELKKVIADRIRLAQTKKIDEELLRRALINAMIGFEWQLVSKLAGMTLEESDAASVDKIRNTLMKKVENLKLKDVEALFIAASLMNDIETEKDIVDLCKLTRVNLKECAEESNKIADELYPDPSKKLIVSFEGMKVKMKEADYLKELGVISGLLKKFAVKDDLKTCNIINPDTRQPNVTFRKDTKTGLYKFSEWISSDGTATGFDLMSENKFKALLKGFGKAVKDKKEKKK